MILLSVASLVLICCIPSLKKFKTEKNIFSHFLTKSDGSLPKSAELQLLLNRRPQKNEQNNGIAYRAVCNPIKSIVSQIATPVLL